jgi:hypothetical protein
MMGFPLKNAAIPPKPASLLVNWAGGSEGRGLWNGEDICGCPDPVPLPGNPSNPSPAREPASLLARAKTLAIFWTSLRSLRNFLLSSFNRLSSTSAAAALSSSCAEIVCKFSIAAGSNGAASESSVEFEDDIGIVGFRRSLLRRNNSSSSSSSGNCIGGLPNKFQPNTVILLIPFRLFRLRSPFPILECKDSVSPSVSVSPTSASNPSSSFGRARLTPLVPLP